MMKTFTAIQLFKTKECRIAKGTNDIYVENLKEATAKFKEEQAIKKGEYEIQRKEDSTILSLNKALEQLSNRRLSPLLRPLKRKYYRMNPYHF